jgi:cell wall-associated NlpC family hydrolase
LASAKKIFATAVPARSSVPKERNEMPARGVVTGNVVNLYSQPRKDVDVVTQAILGTEVAIRESREGWHYVGLPDQYQGWIEAAPVRVYTQADTPYASEGPVAEVTSLLAFLYHKPSVTARAPALQVPIGTHLEVAEEQGDWIQVTLPGGEQPWVQRGDVAISAADTLRMRGSPQDVIAAAKRFLGLPYLWGGCTPLGIDCSGFVQLIYRLQGVSLLRDADIQYTQPGLVPVEKNALLPGDLLFFGQSRITHMGLYIGDGRFIHATTHVRPVVQISHLDEPHWTALFQGARRP